MKLTDKFIYASSEQDLQYLVDEIGKQIDNLISSEMPKYWEKIEKVNLNQSYQIQLKIDKNKEELD